MIIEGTAVVIDEDDVDTDVMYPGQFIGILDDDEMAKHLFEGLDPTLRDELVGDTILVAGANFGTGSSRENVPAAMRAAGIRCVVAKSFARIFHRNCINLGLPAIACPEAAAAARSGSSIRIDDRSRARSTSTARRSSAGALPPFMARAPGRRRSRALDQERPAPGRQSSGRQARGQDGGDHRRLRRHRARRVPNLLRGGRVRDRHRPRRARVGGQLEAELRADGLEFAFVALRHHLVRRRGRARPAVEERFGGLDVLYNNAGVILGKPLVETTDEEWDRMLAVNLRGTFLTMRALVPLMAGRRASIVNIVVRTRARRRGEADRLLRVEGRRRAAHEGGGARARAGHPSQRALSRRHRHSDATSDQPGSAAKTSCARSRRSDIARGRRLGTPDEVVAMAVFLASDEASFVTGSVMTVDSGATAR